MLSIFIFCVFVCLLRFCVGFLCVLFFKIVTYYKDCEMERNDLLFTVAELRRQIDDLQKENQQLKDQVEEKNVDMRKEQDCTDELQDDLELLVVL